MDNNAAVNMLNIYLWAFVLKWCICYGTLECTATFDNISLYKLVHMAITKQRKYYLIKT